MKRSIMKRVVILALISVLTLAGCNGGKDNETKGYDPDQLFVKTVSYPEASEYFLYYRNPDGTETEIAHIGNHLNTVAVIGNNIYYTRYDDLHAVDFQGNEVGVLNGGEGVLSEIISKDDEWLYCHGSKWFTAAGVSPTADDANRVPVYTKVKADLSETHEVTPKELPKLPMEYNRTALYEGILAEVGASLDLIGISSARVKVEPNGSFSEMALDIWAYDSTSDGVDKWNTGKVFVGYSVIHGFNFEHYQLDEETRAYYENPIMHRELASLEGFTVNLETLYNDCLIEEHVIGDPDRIVVMYQDEKYHQYLTKNPTNAQWFDMTQQDTEKLPVATATAQKLIEIMEAQDYFIIVPYYYSTPNPNDKVAFRYNDQYSANLIVVFIPQW